MRRKADIASKMATRRWLGEPEAAVYCTLSPSYFRQRWQSGDLPAPRDFHGRLIWDVLELDAAMEALPRRGEEVLGSVDTWADFGNGAAQTLAR